MNRSATGSAKRSVPCLNSNNCIDPSETGEIKQLPVCHENPKGQSLNEFSTSYRKSTAALEMNVKAFIETFGLDKVGFLTLTFADDVTEPKEAQRRFHSLRTNFLKSGDFKSRQHPTAHNPFHPCHARLPQRDIQNLHNPPES